MTIACFCGTVYLALWGKAICPSCGEQAERAEQDQSTTEGVTR